MAKQKQKQTQIVNIHLGTKARKRKGKGKSKPKKIDRESKQIIPAFNPPPIINYPPMFVAPNQPNWFKPPPVSQTNKEYAVFPEGETAGFVGLNPAVPVRLSFQGAEQVLKPPAAEPILSEIAAQEKAGEEVILPPAEPPLFEEDISLLGGGTLGNYEPPSPAPPTYDSGNPPTVESLLGERQFGRNVALQPFNEPTFAESTSLFIPTVGESKAEEPKRSQKKKSGSSAGAQAGNIHSFFPSLTEAQPIQLNLATGQPTNFPPPLFPAADKRLTPFNVVLEPVSFINQSKQAAEKHKELILTLERQRGAGITPAEESILFA